MMRSARTALMCAALLPALLAQGNVHTSRPGTRLLPLPKEEGVWHFAVYGDRTGGPAEGIEVLKRAVTDTNLLDPDLVMTVGDLVQGYNRTPEWMTQMEEFQGVMRGLRMPWFPVAGNHDVYWRGEGRPAGEHEGSYERHFGPLWYWFPHKDAAFFVLYSDEGDPETGEKSFTKGSCTRMSATQLAWLKAELAKARDKRHVFVFLHHPRWLTERYPESRWDEVHAVLKAAGNVSAVFAGHIHQMVYDGRRDGIEYFALGTTGGEFDHEVPLAGWLHHLDVVTVRKERISVATIPVGAVIDPREITTARVTEITAVMQKLVPRFAAPLAVGADGATDARVACALDNPARVPVEVTLVPRSGDGTWRFVPDHVHRTLQPGETATVEIGCRRGAEGFGDAFTPPEVALRAAWLGDGVRIALPERAAEMPLAVGRLPAAAAPGVLDLDGKRAALRVASDALALGDGPFTVEGWLHARKLAGRRPFVTKTESSEFGLFVDDGKPSFVVHLDGRYRSAEAARPLLEAGRWHHLAGVFDSSEVRLYVDGRLAARADAAGKRTRNRHPLFIGADPDRRGRPTDFLDGLVDEVRVSACARYEGASFAPALRHEPDAKTVLLLHLDHAVGPFVPDEGPRAVHARGDGALRFAAGAPEL